MSKNRYLGKNPRYSCVRLSVPGHRGNADIYFLCSYRYDTFSGAGCVRFDVACNL